eukprot:4539343-Pleurochrysis_carterae.AAC.2
MVTRRRKRGIAAARICELKLQLRGLRLGVRAACNSGRCSRCEEIFVQRRPWASRVEVRVGGSGIEGCRRSRREVVAVAHAR